MTGSTDPKGMVTSTVLDAFYRATEVWVASTPNGTVDIWLEKTIYPSVGFSFSVSAPWKVEHRKNDTTTSPTGDAGLHVFTYYDGLGRTIQTREEAEAGTAGYRVIQTVYDARGQVIVATLPQFESGSAFARPSSTTRNSTYHEYDAVGRPSRIRNGMGASFSGGTPSGLLTAAPTALTADTDSPTGSVLMSYADAGNPWVRVVTDETSEVRKFFLDGFGRTNQITDMTGSTQYANSYLAYDRLGRLVKMTDAKNNITEFAYNDLGQQVAMTDPNLGYWQYQRDEAGRLKTQIDGKGQKINFDYTDVLGRIRSKQIFKADGTLESSVAYSYLTSTGTFTVYPGQLASVTDSEGVKRYSYDVRGRTVKTERSLTKNGQTYTSLTSFDNADRMVQLTYPGGAPVVAYVYDEGGNLDTVQRTDGGTVTCYDVTSFNEQRQINEIAFNGAAVKTTYTYGSTSKRLMKIVTKKGTNPAVQDLSYKYNAVADVLGITDAVNATGSSSATISSLSYDSLHRLKSLTRPGASATTWTHNEIGNLTSNDEEGTGTAGTYDYGTANKFVPHGVRKVGTTKVYGYDAVGNVTHRNGQVLRYDAENQLVSVVSSTGVLQATFGYDEGGSRLWKLPAGGNLQISIGDFYEEKDGKTLYHVFAGTRRVATFNFFGALVNGATANSVYYYHPDHLGSTSVLTDSAGNQADHYEHSAYGRERYNDPNTSFAISHRYTGQVLDAETGFYYYGARYYDPELGRFLQADTVIPGIFDPQNWNRYSYALNNPLKYTDPTGHWPTSVPFFSFLMKARMEPMGSEASALVAVNQAAYGANIVMTPVVATSQLAGGVMLACAPEPTWATKVGATLVIADAVDQLRRWPDGGPSAYRMALEGIYGADNPYLDTAETIKDVGMAPLIAYSLTEPGGSPARPKTLTADEMGEIQRIVEKYNTKINVVGSRAAGAGRNIDKPWLPMGKGRNTRSDIDFKIDVGHPDAQKIIEELKQVGNGAGSAGMNPKWDPKKKPVYAPYFQFEPGKPVQHVK